MYMAGAREKADKLFQKARIFMMGSIDAKKFPNIKAMEPSNNRENISSIYFGTKLSSEHVAQVKKDNKTCIYFYKRLLGEKGVMLTGTMEVLTDKQSRELFWDKSYAKHFPGGADDPEYCILKFSAASGRYFDGKKSEDFTI